MATLEETFNPAALSRSDTIISNAGNTKATSGSSAKQAKATQSYSRIDFEPLYTDLKSLIGHHWGTYYDALTRFIRGMLLDRQYLPARWEVRINHAIGELCATEFGDLCDHFLLATPATEHAHNSLICAILYNSGRDIPDPGPAAWVSAASDKAAGATTSKAVATSDAAEQRLKTEVMALPARDRRRLKGAASDKTEEEAAARRNVYEEYYHASRIKAPEAAPGAAAGLTKTNWDLEIRKRYLQPLFAETLEFPDAATIYARMVPICYEESVAAGTSMHCAELVSFAAEVFIKDFLSVAFNRTRSNGPRYENGAGDGIHTAAYKRQIAREEAEVKNGTLLRNREDDLLPVESKEANTRRPIGIADLQLANRVGPSLWNSMPLIGMSVAEAATEFDRNDWPTDCDPRPTTNGHMPNIDEATDVDPDDDYGWDGTGSNERHGLNSLLADCLATQA